jgi:hypothetical protein
MFELDASKRLDHTILVVSPLTRPEKSEFATTTHTAATTSPVSVRQFPVLPFEMRHCSHNREEPLLVWRRNRRTRCKSLPESVQQPHDPEEEDDPWMVRRCLSTGTFPGNVFPSEQILRERRLLCESSVKRLYEGRKDKILEIFRPGIWLLTDALDDELPVLVPHGSLSE